MLLCTVFKFGLLCVRVGCDAKFFGELMEELAEVVGCFNTRAQELLQQHLASGVRKFLRYLQFSKLDRAAMIQQGRYLVSYAFLNATAVRKILKKYDKVYCKILIMCALNSWRGVCSNEGDLFSKQEAS